MQLHPFPAPASGVATGPLVVERCWQFVFIQPCYLVALDMACPN